MPLIKPSFQEAEPERINQNPYKEPEFDYEKLKKFDEAGTWKCPKCGCIVHNWVKVCPYNTKVFKCRTLKPT